MQRYASAALKQRAIILVAALTVVDAITIALVEPGLSAEPPDRILHVPRKDPWKRWVEISRVDTVSDLSDDCGTASFGIAVWSVQMVRPEPFQNSSPMEPV